MSGVPIRRLVAWRFQEAEKAIAEGAPAFMDLPDAWYDKPHWFCGNGHVSGAYLRRESGPHCLACREPVVLGPHIGEAAFAPILAGLAA